MKPMVLALSGLALLAAATAMAQPTEEQRAQWRAMREARGESAGPRPPEGASQEEKRAFYQKRAAERAQAEAAAVTPAAAAPAASVQSHAAHTAPTPPARKPESGGKPGPGAVPPAPTPAAASGGSRGGGSMGGMPSGTRGGGAIWLSDMPPMRGDAVRPEGSRGGGMGNMSGMEMGGERSGPRVKRLWLRSGADPQKSPFYREEADAAPEMLLVTPQGKPEGEPLPPAEEGKKNLAFPMPAQGFYRVYVTTRKLAGDILNVSVAKAEVANFTHDADEEERTRASGGNRILETAPIEIVREKARNEPTFFQLRSGNEQAFVVLQKGVPLQGARVRFVSHEGWSKDAVSDEQGRVSYQIIRDYFPPWDDFKKRFKATYLVVAEASAAEPGRHKDQPYATVRYQATLAGSYYPSPNDYRSYAWGLGVGLLITLFCGVAVYLYRRRRIKPFQETRLDDVK